MPAQHSLRFSAVFLLLLGTLSWWPGEVVAESVMKTKPVAVDQHGRPILTSEQALQVVLRVAEAVPIRKQLTPEMVKEVTGIQLKPWQKNPKWYDAAGQINASEWFYGFSLYPALSSPVISPAHIFQFSFSERPGIAVQDLSYEPICRPTLSEVDSLLHKSGYTRRQALNNERINYRHGEISILIVSTFTRTARCVRYLSISLPDSISKRDGNE